MTVSPLSATDLSRIQFAFTIAVHIIFPATSIGLASFIAVLEGAWLKTGKPHYRALCVYWSKIFAMAFGMGVVSGVVMAYEFGTNWAGFARFAGSITGPLLTYEVMTAFFLEAGFLGIMLFGWDKVGRRAHFAATVLVALGTLVSTFWILASNSWMQTPQGYAIVNGRAVPQDWFAVIFNPSFPYRLVHMTLAAFLVVALLVSASGAWHLLRGRRDPEVRTMFSMALWMVLVLAPIQIVAGDQHGLNTLRYQPAKIAAIEGLWETEHGGTSLNLVGLPDMNAEVTRDAIRIPHLGSLILTHTWNGEIRGLKTFPKADRPDSTIVFWTFRIMVGLGLLMLLLGVTGAALRRRGRLFECRAFQRFALAMGPAGYLALLMGWATTEVGRQPWVVYGLLRTADAVSPITAQSVGLSMMIFVILYFSVFGTGAWYIFKLIRSGPPAGERALRTAPGTPPGGPNGTTPAAAAHAPQPEAQRAAGAGRRPMSAAD